MSFLCATPEIQNNLIGQSRLVYSCFMLRERHKGTAETRSVPDSGKMYKGVYESQIYLDLTISLFMALSWS